MELERIIKEKALRFAKEVWGAYFDDMDYDGNCMRGEITQEDYFAGYKQALEDSKALEMREMLEKFSMLNEDHYKDIAGFILKTRQLIKEATEFK